MLKLLLLALIEGDFNPVRLTPAMGEIVKMFVFTFSIFSFFCPSEGRGAMSPSYKVTYF